MAWNLHGLVYLICLEVACTEVPLHVHYHQAKMQGVGSPSLAPSPCPPPPLARAICFLVATTSLERAISWLRRLFTFQFSYCRRRRRRGK